MVIFTFILFFLSVIFLIWTVYRALVMVTKSFSEDWEACTPAFGQKRENTSAQRRRKTSIAWLAYLIGILAFCKMDFPMGMLFCVIGAIYSALKKSAPESVWRKHGLLVIYMSACYMGIRLLPLIQLDASDILSLKISLFCVFAFLLMCFILSSVTDKRDCMNEASGKQEIESVEDDSSIILKKAATRKYKRNCRAPRTSSRSGRYKGKKV